MKNERRVSSVEPPSPCFGAPGCRVRPRAGLRRSSFVIRHFQKAFTLIELLTVIAIIGILAALLAPVLKNFSKPDVTVAATRQLLDDCARARQLAISGRTTVFMVFIPTNFWGNNPVTPNGLAWNALPTLIKSSSVVTQLYGAQWNGYMMVSLRNVGDQPGRPSPKDLLSVKTLPSGAFIAPFKFTAPNYLSGIAPPIPTNRPDLPIYGFLYTNTIPFPTANVLTNAGPPNIDYLGTFESIGGLNLPYIAFNYLGQLTTGDGTVLPYDENIPLDYGSIAEPVSLTSKLPIQGLPSVIESPPGNSTNSAYNVIHIDRITGRARLERQDQL
jgi:prepilin-type N-terminal cleavage/methylation domain-containing protein